MKKNEYLDFVMQDVLGHIPNVTSRAMLGGYGIYKNGVIFAIIADDQLYFKVGESNKKHYEEKGSKPFVYEMGKHKRTTMSYWLVPDEVMEDKEKIKKWVQMSIKISKQNKKK